MPLLYYWQPDNYRRDLDYGVGYHLNQSNPKLHEIQLGDSLWAFTRHAGRYVLAAELVIKAKTLNSTSFRYGKYRVWGDLALSRYFQVEAQPNLEGVFRRISGRTASILAQAFQGRAAVRQIDDASQQILQQLAMDLPTEPRARLLPEERLEAQILLADGDAIRRLIVDEDPGLVEARRRYLYETVPTRNRQLTDELHEMYASRCQICLWDPRTLYGKPLSEAHHVVWLSRGGDDALENLMLVCPNHHRAIHRCDAHLDYGMMALCFSPAVREPLQLNHHLI